MAGRAFAASLTVALATAGCATTPQQARWVEMRPLQVGAERQISASDGYYAGAVAAIDRRDYAAALELLQLARARAPSDVRVFNAFGVVYDKLGRFDLSARYYSQAAALQPSSPIVAANVAYSAVLERQIGQPVEGVRLARIDGDLKPMARADLAAEAPPVLHRVVDAPQTLSVAASAAPVRIQAVRLPPASGAVRRMPSPDLILPAPEPEGVAVARAPAAPSLPVTRAALTAPVAPPAPPKHVLYAVVGPVAPSLVSTPTIRIDAAGRPMSVNLRAVAHPIFAAPAAEPPAANLPRPPAPPVQMIAAAHALPMRAAPVIRLRADTPASPAVVKLGSTTVVPRRLPLLTGNRLVVINASGRRAGGDPVATRLAHLGWSLPRSAQTGRVQRQTSIVYPARNAAVARALARTLPYRVRLVACTSSCDRMRLVVGADALQWRKGARPGSMVKVKIA